MGVVLWAALLESGVDPVVAGLAIGLAGLGVHPEPGHPRARLRPVPAASARSRPPELARDGVSVGLIGALSPNARLQRFYLPWTSYLIVPRLRPGQRRRPARRRLPRAGRDLADHARHRRRLRRRQAGRGARRELGGHPAQRWTDAAAGRVGRGRRAAARSPASAFTVSLLIATLAFDGRRPRRGQARRARRQRCSPWPSPALVFRVTRRLPPSAGAAAPCSATPSSSSTWPTRSTPSATTCAGRSDASGHAGGVRRLRVPALRRGRAGRPRRARRRRGPALRLAAPAADRRAPARRSSPPRRPRQRASRGRFWPMHDLLLDHQEDLTPRDLLAYAARARPGRRRASPTTWTTTGTPTGSPPTWTPPTAAASPARRRSSSTAAATTAPTTPRRCARRSRWHACDGRPASTRTCSTERARRPLSAPGLTSRSRVMSAIVAAPTRPIVRSSSATTFSITSVDAAGAGQREAVEVRAAEQAGVGAQGERQEDVGAGADAAVEQDRRVRARRASRTVTSASSEAMLWSTWRPPWLDTTSPSTPASSARSASSGCRIPLSTIGSVVRPRSVARWSHDSPGLE